MSDTPSTLGISAILIQEADGSWSAQCLQYDIAAHAQAREDVEYELQRILIAQIAISLELKQEPFAGLKPAPRLYWEMFERAKEHVEVKGAPFGLPEGFPGMTIVPRLEIAEQRVAYK